MSDAPKVYEQDLSEFLADPANPNKGNDRGRAALKKSIEKLGVGRSLVADKHGHIVAGNKTREALLAAGKTKAVVVEVDGDTPVIVQRKDMDLTDPSGSAREYAFADNRVGELSLTWDEHQLVEAIDKGLNVQDMWDDKELGELLEAEKKALAAGGGNSATRSAAAQALVQKFVVPPFTVLDAKQGYWQERKRAWHGLGINPVAGREHLGATSTVKADYGSGRGADAGGSSFDPVLAELCCRWFCTPGGHVLDPFAGESTKGIVAGHLGYQYTGIELRPAQVQVNQEQAAFVGCSPRWIIGDSSQLEQLLPPGEQYDLMFTSPPYYDLEIYSQSEKDGSAFKDYPTFIAWYAAIIKASCARLKDDRFAVVKVGETRDKKTGVYYNFVGDTIKAFSDAGMAYYNEAVLLTPIGSMPIRAGRHFNVGRKLEKGHQNVLVFYKGDPKHVRNHFGDVECGELAPAPGEEAPV